MASTYGVTIELDRSRSLRFDVNALAELEGALGGRSVAEVLSGENIGFAAIRALLWAGLRHEDRGITLERAGTLMQKAIDNGGSLAELLGKVSGAITSCGVFGKVDEPVAGENPPTAAA